MLKLTSSLIAAAFPIFLFSINSSVAENISANQTGNINLGTSSYATLSLSSGGILNGNVTMGNAAQIITFNDGILNGTINGAGKVLIATDTILNGNIGSASAVSSLTINANKTLNLAINNNSISAAGNLNISNNATLLVGTGTISASIQSSNKGSGTVIFSANNTLGGSVGTSATTLALIEIASGANLITSSKNIDATKISIADNGILNYGSGTIIGAVEGKIFGVGNFTFNNTKTTAFSIGQTNSLENINVIDGATVTLGGNIAATSINVGRGSSGRLKSNNKNIITTNINLAKGAVLEIAAGSIISGVINGNIDGDGIVQFSGSSAITQNFSLGINKKLSQVLISNETTLNINDNITFNADDITIGEGGTSGIIQPVLNQNNGTIGANSDSLIKLGTNAVFNYSGGKINGTVRGTSSGKGTFNVNQNYTNNFEIGKSYDIANLNIAKGTVLTANANISANNISVAGTLNLGSSPKNIIGNLTTSGGAAIVDFGSAGHAISGDFLTLRGDIIKLNALNANVGNLKVAGNATIADGINLKITFDSNVSYFTGGNNFAFIISSSEIGNAVADKNIDVNDSGSNKSGLITFHTKKSGNNLILTVDRKGAESFTDNKFAATIYNGIDQVGAVATGELRDLQKIIDSTAVPNSTREAILKSVVPQNNQDLSSGSFNSANSSVNVSGDRLQKAWFNVNNSPNFNNFRNFSNFSGKENIANLDNLKFSDDQIFDNQAIWLQGFGTSATQKTVGDSFGYNYSNHGLAVGADQEIAENFRLGISSSFGVANIKSNSASNKDTNIDSYQINLYGGYNFSSYFITGILGVAINKYNSVRAMPELGLQAKSNYGGQTYIAKFESGMVEDLGCNFKIIPKISLTAAENQIATYSETGAGTLNLVVSNQHNAFLEGELGSDLSYDNLTILSLKVTPKIRLNYGYNFLGKEQTSINHFQGQNSSFEIKNSNQDQSSLKYGFGLDIYSKEGILLIVNYGVEKKSNYEAKSGSIYLRYNF